MFLSYYVWQIIIIEVKLKEDIGICSEIMIEICWQRFAIWVVALVYLLCYFFVVCNNQLASRTKDEKSFYPV